MLGWPGGLLRAVPAWLWVVMALGLWGGWQRHQATSQAKARAQAEQTAALATAAEAAQRRVREAENRINNKARKATDDAHRLAAVAAADADAARTELERLRLALPSATAASGASAPATPASGPDAATTDRVVAACAAELVAVATNADACGARLSGLQAWVRAVLPDATTDQPPDK